MLGGGRWQGSRNRRVQGRWSRGARFGRDAPQQEHDGGCFSLDLTGDGLLRAEKCARQLCLATPVESGCPVDGLSEASLVMPFFV